MPDANPFVRLQGAVARDDAIDEWFPQQAPELDPIGQRWFRTLRQCRPDMLELIHDGCPVACVGDLPFAFVNERRSHARPQRLTPSDAARNCVVAMTSQHRSTLVADHPNIAVMRNAVAAFGSGDPVRLAQAFAPDVEWRVPGRSALAGIYRGQTEVFGFFGALMQQSNGSFRIDPLELYASDDGGVFVDRITAERAGKQLHLELVLRVQIANGKITRGIDHFHEEHVWDAFWA